MDSSNQPSSTNNPLANKENAMSIEKSGKGNQSVGKMSIEKAPSQAEILDPEQDDLIDKMLTSQLDAQKRNQDMMREYYRKIGIVAKKIENVFPFELIERWLSYCNCT